MEQREKVVAKRLSETPISARNTLKLAYSGAGGKANAIRAMCLHCTGYDRDVVRNCTGYSCPLWHYRPFQVSEPCEPQAALG